ncbi:MAG: thioesterase [Propionibacteriaceae bacterium]|uniref:HotDog domain n=1 Tax=Propionibacterium ruminifibrarum TaxID=1962131 RepID=A0A375HYE8_9ACTN|nr:thioesterase family protein [Propionibacterium ruminifibrarum]MBE6477246.1 thioesterase [Propionibacteriaceae bacterium]SPF67600.1 HotDog domain [Propionibacterium ruminifibrarum]
MAFFTVDIPLRWSDLDPQGHINNVMTIDFTQEARARFMMDSRAPQLLVDGCVMVSQQVEYLRSMLYSDEPLTVEFGTVEVRAARFIMGYRIWHEGQLRGRVRTAMCPFDFEAQRLRPLTADERRALTDIAIEGEARWRPLPKARLRGRGEPTRLFARWSDQDRYGHVNNVRTIDWIQQARIEATTAIDPSMARAGMGRGASAGNWVVARQEIDYVEQMQWRPEPYIGYTAPLHVGTTSVTLGCEICDQQAPDAPVLTRSRTVLVHTGDDGRPSPLSDSTVAAMRARLVTD